MLVRDYTKQYSPLGQFNGFGADWGSLISGIGDAVKSTVGSVTNIIETANRTQGGTAPTQGTVSPGGTLNFGPAPVAVVQSKSWYQDPLMLGAAGLGVLGLLFVLKGGRRGFSGFSGAPRRRRSRSRR